MSDLQDWLTPNGMIAEKGISNDNDILNWANYLLGKKKLDQTDKDLTEKFLGNNGWPEIEFTNNSHDNHVAVLSLCSMFLIPFKSVAVRRYWEPRVFIFDKIFRNGGIWWLFYPLLLIIMIISCLTNKKVRPAWWQKDWWVHNYKRATGQVVKAKEDSRDYKNIKVEEITGWLKYSDNSIYFTRKIFKTDGKILAIHRVNALIMVGHNMKYTNKVLDWCLIRSIGDNWRHDIMRIFYRKNDPIFEAWS